MSAVLQKNSALQEIFSLFDRSRDPYRTAPKNLRELQLEAMRERFAERRQQIRVLDKRATDSGIKEIRSEHDMVPLLFAHQAYKTYPEHFLEQGRWAHMNLWLQTLTTRPVTGMNLEGITDVDDWIARLREVGHYVFSSSGTSGKPSFVSQTAEDLDRVVEGCVILGMYGNALIKRDLGKRPLFLMMPEKGAHRHVEGVNRAAAILGREKYLMFSDPATAGDAIRMGRMRRALTDGTAKPSEIEAFQASALERQKRTNEQIEAFLDKLLARRNEPLLIQGQWAMHWHLVEAARQRGVPDGTFHPETVITAGGGLKGVKVPADYREQVFSFYGIGENNLQTSYGMSEMIGTGPYSPVAKGFATCPWIVPLILDKSGEKLLNPADGKGTVEGRFAFFDLLAEGYWGGLITGDKVTVDFSSQADDIKTPLVTSVARYADLEEGEDKLSCAGTMEAYVRGMINT